MESVAKRGKRTRSKSIHLDNASKDVNGDNQEQVDKDKLEAGVDKPKPDGDEQQAPVAEPESASTEPQNGGKVNDTSLDTDSTASDEKSPVEEKKPEVELPKLRGRKRAVTTSEPSETKDQHKSSEPSKKGNKNELEDKTVSDLKSESDKPDKAPIEPETTTPRLRGGRKRLVVIEAAAIPMEPLEDKDSAAEDKKAESDKKAEEKNKKSAESEKKTEPETPKPVGRGRKRGASEMAADTSTPETPSTPAVEEAEKPAPNDESSATTPTPDLSASESKEFSITPPTPAGLGKGKRARVPNKRYSDFPLTDKHLENGELHRSLLNGPPSEGKEDASEVPAANSPVVNLRKSSGASSGSPAPKKAKVAVDITNPIYLRPLKLGWKRELVYRASGETGSKRNADVYYYAPSGKKVRSMREVSENLKNKELTLEDFTFFKEPLGIDDPEKEIIRDAKLKTAGGTPLGKKVATPKEKKKAETVSSPQTAPDAFEADSPKGKGTPKMGGFKVKLPRTLNKKRSLNRKSKDNDMEIGTYPPDLEPSPSSTKKFGKRASVNASISSGGVASTQQGQRPCNIHCFGVRDIVPKVQCRVCLCLYHRECVGLSIQAANDPFMCKNCLGGGQAPSTIASPPSIDSPASIGSPTSISAPPPLTPIPTPSPAQQSINPHLAMMPKLQRIPKVTDAPALNLPQLPEPPMLIPKEEASASPTKQQIPPPLVPKEEACASPPKQPSTPPKPVAPQKQLVVCVKPAKQVSPSKPSPPKQLNALKRLNPPKQQSPLKQPSPIKQLPEPPKPAGVAESVPASKSLVGGVTTWFPSSSTIQVNHGDAGGLQINPMRPQFVEYFGMKKFLVIPKHNILSVSPVITPLDKPKTADHAPVQIDSITTPDTASLGPNPVKSEPSSPIASRTDLSVMDCCDTEPDCKSKDGETESSPAKAKPATTPQKSARKVTRTSQFGQSPQSGDVARFDDQKSNQFMQDVSYGYNTLLYVFQYLKVQELLRASCVCTMWRDIASHPILWRTVRMKNSQIHDFEGLTDALQTHGTIHLDLRKMLIPSGGDNIWGQFSKGISKVESLRKIELCRCPAVVIEQLALSNQKLEVINAVTIKCETMSLAPLVFLKDLHELRLKSTAGFTLTSDLTALSDLTQLKHLSLTSIKDLNKLNIDVIADLRNLESLDLGECADFPRTFGSDILTRLTKLEKLRLEKGQGNCHTFEVLEAVKTMPHLEQLELVNFDIKMGFDKALGACTNIKKLLIIPTYISQSATTNHMVLGGVLRLQPYLTHFVWGVTLELLRVTELFVDQCGDDHDKKKSKKPSSNNGDSIPVLKPVPLLPSSVTLDIPPAQDPPQVEILPLPNLQKLLLQSLPTTRVKILKIPFHATWRQTINDSVN